MSTKTTDLVTNPHDQFFRDSMKDLRVTREFLTTHLPPEIRILVDLDTLELQPRSQSNAVRRESTVDVLFKTKIDRKEAYIYLLLEHQSSPDPLMSFRVIQYTVNAIHEHLKRHKTSTIPLIYPLVVYHGRPYQFITNINDLIDAPRELVDTYFLKPFHLLDLNQIDDEIIKQNTWSGIMEFTLKHIFKQDILPFFQDMIPLLQTLHQNEGHDYMGIVLQYMLERGEVSDADTFFELINKNISNEVGEKIMSLAEQLKLEGKLEGKLETAKNMLLEGCDPVFIVKVTKLTLVEINAIRQSIPQQS